MDGDEPLEYTYDDPWDLLSELCEEVAWPGGGRAEVTHVVDGVFHRVGFRLARAGRPPEHYLVGLKRLREGKPEGMPDNVWAAFQGEAALEHLAGVVGRGVPRAELGHALPGLCVHNPAGLARLDLAR